MDIAYANKGISCVECTNYIRGYWRIRWDFQPIEPTEDDELSQDMVSFKEHQFDHKPTMDEVKSVITANSKQEYDWGEYERILSIDERKSIGL